MEYVLVLVEEKCLCHKGDARDLGEDGQAQAIDFRRGKKGDGREK